MKDLCMSKEQYKGINDLVNDQGFEMHGQPFGSFTMGEKQYSKAKKQRSFNMVF